MAIWPNYPRNPHMSRRISKPLVFVSIQSPLYAKLMNLSAVITRIFSFKQEGFQFVVFLASVFLGFHQNHNALLNMYL